MKINHHTEETACPLCYEKLGLCDPFLTLIYKVIKSEFPDVHISWGFRDKFDQDECFKLKKSRLQWPYSMHNVMKDGKPSSRAIDLFRINDLGKAEFERSYFLQIAQFLYKNTDRIQWSGDWQNDFKESDHYQLKEPE